MDLITFRCGACNQVLKISADKAGRKAKCRCGAELTIPLVSEDPGRAVTTPAPSTRAAAVSEEEEGAGSYGIAAEPELPLEAEKPKEKPKDKALAAPQDEEEIERKRRRRAALRKAPLDPVIWERIRVGILVVLIATCLGIVGFLLQRAVLVVGILQGPEYAAAASSPWLIPPQSTPVPGEALELDKSTFLVALQAGTDSAETGLWLMRIGQVLILLQGLMALAGYAICLVVPPRFGTRGLLVAGLSLGLLNLLLQLVFKLLPLAGAMDYTLVPLVGPETVMTVGNIDRTVPLPVYWSEEPFWEMLGSLIIQMLFFAEPVIFCLFLRAMALSIRDERLQALANALVVIALGTAFAILAYYVLSVTGTSEVMGWVFRVIYSLWVAFYLGQLLWYTGLLKTARTAIESKLAEEE